MPVGNEYRAMMSIRIMDDVLLKCWLIFSITISGEQHANSMKSLQNYSPAMLPTYPTFGII